MKYVVCYDVSDDGIRTRVSKVLEGLGERVQESVFECRLTDEQLLEALTGLASALEDGKNGNIRVYQTCERCEKEAMGIGSIVRPLADGGAIVP